MPLNNLQLPLTQTDLDKPGLIRLSGGWRFQRFETENEEPAKLEALEMDDSAWRQVDLPHDWGIEGPFRAELPGNTGKLPWHGIGWYRKAFEAPELLPGERLLLLFEGAMSHPKVWVNGELVGEWAYGYNSFTVDVTEAVCSGQPSQLSVRLDNPPESSRWYPGGGLYRDVWLMKKPAVSVEEWSTFIQMPQVSRATAQLEIGTTIRNGTSEPVQVDVRHVLMGPDLKQVADVEAGRFEMAAGASIDMSTRAILENPALWDLTTPQLHTCRTEIHVAGELVGAHETPFGIRSIEWTADDGFHLNGRRVQINGVCQHHDLGALGAAFNHRAAERQLEILREMGCNAIRMAHNPPAPALLDLCDQMGFLVINELFDNWAISKTPGDYSRYFEEWHERDMRNWICRDRNHPSIIAWSLGNEIREQEDHPGNHDRARHLVELCHRHDRTRPSTVGMNDGESIINGFAPIFDVAGYNYKAVLDKSLNYQTHIEAHPRLPLYGAETSSCLSSRGVYFFPVSKEKTGGFFNFQVSSYDLYSPGWGYAPDVEFDSLDRFPSIAGEFVWSGFDYLGEPTPYNTDKTNALNFSDPEAKAKALAELERLGSGAPSRSSYFGIIDLAGFPKDRYFMHQARWRPDMAVAHLLPHWNWQGREGEITPVHAYSNGDEAELFLNGKSLGRQRMGRGTYRFVWEDVRYEPGKLELVTWRKGKQWTSAIRETSGPPASLRASVDRPRIFASGRDLAFIRIEILDDAGRIVPNACPELQFTVEGAAEFVAADNGDPIDWTPFNEPSRKAFNGLALAILRGRPDFHGKSTLHVASPGLASTCLSLEVCE